ncbi:MAG: DUF11 domain-containing protein [Saccharospirillaceae bacterium]|nr:hypothetical protein A3759_02285 [Thalassolituus sp. HI0120]MCH2040687.1 DUF11 domain-containing protein [Saccharospirillaceae bacterium]
MVHSITIHSNNPTRQWLGFYKLTTQGFVWLFFVTISLTANSEEEILLRESFAGNISFAMFGNTMRNGCSNLGSSSASLSLPTGSTVKAAYLYWSGSGSADNTVTFDGQSVTASFDKRYTEQVGTQDFYSNRADITSRISGNKSYQVSGLNFDGSSSYCNGGRAYGGWAAVVIYENSLEPLRIVNIFDGFKNFWGTSITLTPNNFVIADNPAALGGKHAHITWEGDEGNSYQHPSTGTTETLTFNGQTLSDANNPSSNQFNSYSNANISAATRDTDGVDLDVYEIGNYLISGATSVSTTYATGQDRVFLSAEIISVPNLEVADLSISSLSSGNALVNSQTTIDLTLSNNGPNATLANSQIQFTLPTGLSLNSQTGSGWSCAATSSLVTCTYAPIINSNDQSEDLSIILNTTVASVGTHNIEVTASNSQFDNIPLNNSSTTSIDVSAVDLSLSTKQVTDLNGGNVEEGDILRYTITLNEANGASLSGVTIQDTFQDAFSEIAVVSSQGGTTGPISGNVFTRSGITIPAGVGNTITIEIDAVIKNDIATGTVISNSALLSISDGQHWIQAPDLTVAAKFTAEPGNKALYLNNVTSMTRTPYGALPEISFARGESRSWVITPALEKDLQLSPTAKGVVVRLHLRHTGSNRNGRLGQIRRNHDITFRLEKSDGTLLASAVRDRVLPANQQLTVFDFHIPYTSTAPTVEDLTIAAGDTLTLRITQDLMSSPDNGVGIPDGMAIQINDGFDTSKLILPVSNVINVDQIQFFDKPFADNTRQQISRSNLNRNIYINATVSDPFGRFDITSANVAINDTADEEILAATDMTIVDDTVSGQKIYEYNYSIPALIDHPGDWRFSVTAKEGTENEISHQRQQLIEILQLMPNVALTKSSTVVNDPINGTNNPKAIPGAEIIYQLLAINSGEGSPDSDTVIIDEQIPEGFPLFVGDLSLLGPVDFIDGTAPDSSGLSYTFISLDAANDDIDFSNDYGNTFSYTPTPSGDGYDGNVTHIRLKPKGIFKAADTIQPQFQFNYKVKVQ